MNDRQVSNIINWLRKNIVCFPSSCVLINQLNHKQVALGLVVALNYKNPFLNPYEEFQVMSVSHNNKNFAKQFRTNKFEPAQ